MAGVAVHPLDPELGIAWPVPVDLNDRAQLSAKDAANPSLAEVMGQAVTEARSDSRSDSSGAAS